MSKYIFAIKTNNSFDCIQLIGYESNFDPINTLVTKEGVSISTSIEEITKHFKFNKPIHEKRTEYPDIQTLLQKEHKNAPKNRENDRPEIYIYEDNQWKVSYQQEIPVFLPLNLVRDRGVFAEKLDKILDQIGHTNTPLLGEIYINEGSHKFPELVTQLLNKLPRQSLDQKILSHLGIKTPEPEKDFQCPEHLKNPETPEPKLEPGLKKHIFAIKTDNGYDCVQIDSQNSIGNSVQAIKVTDNATTIKDIIENFKKVMIRPVFVKALKNATDPAIQAKLKAIQIKYQTIQTTLKKYPDIQTLIEKEQKKDQKNNYPLIYVCKNELWYKNYGQEKPHFLPIHLKNNRGIFQERLNSHIYSHFSSKSKESRSIIKLFRSGESFLNLESKKFPEQAAQLLNKILTRETGQRTLDYLGVNAPKPGESFQCPKDLENPGKNTVFKLDPEFQLEPEPNSEPQLEEPEPEEEKSKGMDMGI